MITMIRAFQKALDIEILENGYSDILYGYDWKPGLYEEGKYAQVCEDYFGGPIDLMGDVYCEAQTDENPGACHIDCNRPYGDGLVGGFLLSRVENDSSWSGTCTGNDLNMRTVCEALKGLGQVE